VSPADVNWQDLLDLHVVKKLRELVRRRFAVEIGWAAADGTVIDATREGRACVGEALRAAAGASGRVRFQCTAHQRTELASPILVDGTFLGCAFAPMQGDDDLLEELVELSAEEMVSFSREAAEKARRDARDYQTRYPYEAIIGNSRPMRDLYRLLDKVIDSDSTVLVNGENGTGKELIARAIHYNSIRATNRFVVQNCSAFNDNLLDSELFGHKKGAFTGAIADKQGLFEVADRGTFFLDEIGDMSPALQVKVLRVLQEGTLTPVGDTQTRTVDVRIIAATNRDLKRMVERGEFREDLYYRINVIQLTVPPLRERKEDVLLLIDHFLRRNSKGRRLKQKKLSQNCLDRMMEYAWPGNIRELENEIERLVVLAGDDKLIGEELLSPRIRQALASRDGEGGAAGAREASSLPDAVDALEKNLIYEVLRRNQWNKTKAAEELRISRRNLIRKVNKYKLDSRRRGA
jgi:two-component system, NtrC family, response regulator HupR/HoxA